MIVEDLRAFMADHGSEVKVPGQTTVYLGILDGPDQNLPMSGAVPVQSREYELLMITDDVTAAGIVKGSGLTVNVRGIDKAFTARIPAQVDDGAFTNIPLTAT